MIQGVDLSAKNFKYATQQAQAKKISCAVYINQLLDNVRETDMVNADNPDQTQVQTPPAVLALQVLLGSSSLSGCCAPV